MKCHVCGKTPAEGTTLYRQNPKGEKGIWACLEHSKPLDMGLRIDVAIIESEQASS